MNPGYELKTDIDDDKPPEQETIIPPSKQTTNKFSKPMVAGILLIIAGVLSIISWTQMLFIDITTIESIYNISEIQQMIPDITPEQIVGLLNTCAIIGIVISIFPILGGILALKKKLWSIALVGSIIGLFSIGMLFTSSGLSLIALILLIISREEFESNKK